MKLSLNRFDSETVRASIEGYKQKFPLPNRLSNKNILKHSRARQRNVTISILVA